MVDCTAVELLRCRTRLEGFHGTKKDRIFSGDQLHHFAKKVHHLGIEYHPRLDFCSVLYQSIMYEYVSLIPGHYLS
jgi:hypothetical protein